METQTISLFIKELNSTCGLTTTNCCQGTLYTNIVNGSVITLIPDYTITINSIINNTIVYTISGNSYSITNCIGLCESINIKLPLSCCNYCIIRISTIETTVLPDVATV